MKPPAFWFRPPGATALALRPLGALYQWAGALRRLTASPLRLPVPVICVGNLSLGGTGKTPVALSLLTRLAAMGLRPQALSRGYGGAAKGPLRVDPARHSAFEVGDEPLLLARATPVWVARDRAAGGLAAVEAGAGCLVMDDGHQNPALVKDLSLIVADGGVGFGNGLTFPAGPLRESVAAGLARADAVVVAGDDVHGVARIAAERGLPALTARLAPDPAAAAALKGRRVLAFAGIGRPQKFFDTAAAVGAHILGTVAFPDHHPFTAAELAALQERAAALGAELATTEKDRVRLPPALRDAVAVLPVNLLWDDESALDALLERLKQP